MPLPHQLETLYTNIHALYNDGDDLWIGTFSKGLNRYNLKTGKLVKYTHSDDPLSISQNSAFHCVRTDRGGIVVFGTLSGGVDIYDEKK